MDYRNCVKDLLLRLLDAGYVLKWVDDGGDEDELHWYPTLYEATEAVCSVDESTVQIGRDGAEHTLYIVLGNAEHEIVCDYTISDTGSGEDADFERILGWFSTEWSEKTNE